MKVRVARKAQEAVNIASYELVRSDGGALPPFAAGSHIDVTTPDGIVRQYSLCNTPAQTDRYLICVLKDGSSRGGSKAMHELVVEGSELIISEPRNHFALAHGASRSLLFAGGIGITPILCMAERLAVAGEDFTLHYAARSEASMAFRDHIRRSPYAGNAQFHFDDGAAEQKLNLVDRISQPEPGMHLYVCGPAGFMEAVLSTARAAGWPEPQLHYEFFSAEVTHLDSDERFEVTLASSGQVIEVGKDMTVLDALAAAGLEVPSSCKEGVCGTCLTRVIEGKCDHRDLYLSEEEREEGDQFLPCVSRAKSRMLVLDL